MHITETSQKSFEVWSGMSLISQGRAQVPPDRMQLYKELSALGSCRAAATCHSSCGWACTDRQGAGSLGCTGHG